MCGVAEVRHSARSNAYAPVGSRLPACLLACLRVRASACAHWWRTLRVGKYGPSRILKKTTVLFATIKLRWFALQRK